MSTQPILTGALASVVAFMQILSSGVASEAAALWGVGAGLVVAGISYGVNKNVAKSAHNRIDEMRVQRSEDRAADASRFDRIDRTLELFDETLRLNNKALTDFMIETARQRRSGTSSRAE